VGGLTNSTRPYTATVGQVNDRGQWPTRAGAGKQDKGSKEEKNPFAKTKGNETRKKNR